MRLPAGAGGGSRLPTAPFFSRESEDADDEDDAIIEAVRGECGLCKYTSNPSLLVISRACLRDCVWLLVVADRCVAPEPVLCRSADGEQAGSTDVDQRAGPKLSGEKIVAGRLIWPGQVVKGRERAASSWVGCDGKTIPRPRCVEVLDGDGCWLPICEEADEEEEDLEPEDLRLFRSLGSETR